MFQYAALRGIAKNNGYDFSIPLDGHRLFDVFEMNNCSKREENKIVMQERTHSDFNFDKDLFENCANYTDLHGYFQTEKYFLSIENSIREDFKFKSPREDLSTRIKNEINKESIVSIHVRRGDYVSLQNHHPLLDLGYYEMAKDIFNNAGFVIFSDDIEWCKKQHIFKDDMIMDRTSDEIDLYLMTAFDHNIIANSSFSWWGAWLNSNYHKIIISPKKWFGPAYHHYDMSDLYPARWIQI